MFKFNEPRSTIMSVIILMLFLTFNGICQNMQNEQIIYSHKRMIRLYLEHTDTSKAELISIKQQLNNSITDEMVDKLLDYWDRDLGGKDTLLPVLLSFRKKQLDIELNSVCFDGVTPHPMGCVIFNVSVSKNGKTKHVKLLGTDSNACTKNIFRKYLSKALWLPAIKNREFIDFENFTIVMRLEPQ